MPQRFHGGFTEVLLSMKLVHGAYIFFNFIPQRIDHMKYLLFLLPALLLAGCGPAGSNKPVVVAPVAPVTYPLSDIFTGFLQSAHSFVLTGKNEIQLPETWTATYIPGNITTFEGNSAHQTRISAQVAKLGGYIIDQGTGVIYFRLNPTRITGVESNSDTDV